MRVIVGPMNVPKMTELRRSEPIEFTASLGHMLGLGTKTISSLAINTMLQFKVNKMTSSCSRSR